MEYTEEELALIWLCGCTKFELHDKYLLYSAAPTAWDLFLDFEKIFPKVILKQRQRVYKVGDLSARREILNRYLNKMQKEGRFAVTIASPDYPESLRMLEKDAPLALFGEGNRELLEEDKITIVGSRRTPIWAEDFGESLSERLAGHIAVVSGLAEGGDAAAMRGAIQRGRAISVLPCGLDECYPPMHHSLKRQIAENGLLLTECTDKEKAERFSFPIRNRILAAISQATMVLSAGKKSGALNTAYQALDLGKDLFAFPYNANSEQGAGCNDLIKRGAHLVTDAKDILFSFGIIDEEQIIEEEFSLEELKVIEALCGEEAMHTALVAEKAQIPLFEVTAILSMLELKGTVAKSGANRYTLLVQKRKK